MGVKELLVVDVDKFEAVKRELSFVPDRVVGAAVCEEGI
jgi:hypothetical protein